MNRSTLRLIIIVTAVVTALVHLGLGVSGILNFGLNAFGILFVSNSLSHLGAAAVASKLAELLLMVSTWMHLRAAA